MARGLTKKAKVERYDDLVRELSTYQSLAWHVFNGDAPNAVETVREKDRACHYEYRLYGAERADGGTLAEIYRCKGQPAHVSAFRFDDWFRRVELMPFGVGINTDIKIAADRLRIARQRLFDKSGAG